MVKGGGRRGGKRQVRPTLPREEVEGEEEEEGGRERKEMRVSIWDQNESLERSDAFQGASLVALRQ